MRVERVKSRDIYACPCEDRPGYEYRPHSKALSGFLVWRSISQTYFRPCANRVKFYMQSWFTIRRIVPAVTPEKPKSGIDIPKAE